MLDIKKALVNIANNFQQKPILLWTNPNPTSTFAPQTINSSSAGWVGPSDLSSYTALEIKFRFNPSYDCIYVSRTKVGELGECSGASGYILSGNPFVSLAFRRFRVSTTGVAFESGTEVNTQSTNGVMIPLEIYGVK